MKLLDWFGVIFYYNKATLTQISTFISIKISLVVVNSSIVIVLFFLVWASYCKSVIWISRYYLKVYNRYTTGEEGNSFPCLIKCHINQRHCSNDIAIALIGSTYSKKTTYGTPSPNHNCNTFFYRKIYFSKLVSKLGEKSKISIYN